MNRPVRVLHLTPGLESGGAETLLWQLTTRADSSRLEQGVVSLSDGGPVLGERIRAAGVPLALLGFRRGLPDPRMAGAIRREVTNLAPDVVQTWLPHADFAGALAVPRRVPLVWGLHNTPPDPARAKRTLVLLTRLNARLSGRPARVVCCSEAVRDACAALGYPSEKLTVIANGVDTDVFVPDSAARGSVRRELELDDNAPLVGLMARFDPQKDHATFFRAAGLLHQARPDAHFVLCGAGVTKDNPHLARLAQENSVERVTYLLGLRQDTPRITAALDAATCCSCYGESFALVLAEAMACGVPVVCTDMAGPVSVVGDCGRVVPIGDARALAAAWQEILSLPVNEHARLAECCRHRALLFSVERMVQGYESLYDAVCAEQAAAVRPSVLPGKTL